MDFYLLFTEFQIPSNKLRCYSDASKINRRELFNTALLCCGISQRGCWAQNENHMHLCKCANMKLEECFVNLSKGQHYHTATGRQRLHFNSKSPSHSRLSGDSQSLPSWNEPRRSWNGPFKPGWKVTTFLPQISLYRSSQALKETENKKFRCRASFALPVHLTFKPSVPPWLQYSWLVYSILPNQHNKVCDEADKI